MKRKVGNGRGGGGDSDPSDLVVKKRRKRKRKGKNEGEMTTPSRLDHCWSRSPSPGGEGRRRDPKTILKWVVGFRRVSLSFSPEVSSKKSLASPSLLIVMIVKILRG